MQFTPHQTTDPLNPWIEAIFHYADFVPEHSIERVVPTGHVFVLFELDGFTRHTYDNATLQPNANFSGAWVSGIHDQYLSISAHAHSEMLVIQFKPYGAYPFLGIDSQQLANRVVPAKAVDATILKLRDNLVNAATVPDKFSHVESWLDARHNTSRHPPDSVIDLVDALVERPTEKLTQILADFEGSQKHLISLFKRYVGVTPKVLQRVFRFNEIFNAMHAREAINWAELAAICGYADQSHLIREFRRFSGFNPAEFTSAGIDNEEGNFFPLDRPG